MTGHVKQTLALATLLVGGASTPTEAQSPQLQPVPFSAVDVRSEFWATRQRVNRRKTIPHLIDMCEREGRVRNLWRAAGTLDGDFEGTRTHDADLFKVIEAASYTLVRDVDPQLNGKLDELIAAVAAAQRDDGYLHTYAQVRARGGRPTQLNLFAAGHLIHAGSAHFQATGKRDLLTVAARMADLILSQYGPDKEIDVPSHPILESALFRLAAVMGQGRYADLAMFFLNQRGHAGQSGRRSYGMHGVDDVPLRELQEARGHVIITLFLLNGMVDGGIRFDDDRLLAACRRTYEDAVTRRMYATGGMGRQADERFTEPYALDNRTSIGEGCQSWALMQLAQRLLLLDADARYADVIERVMYNNLAANVGLDGTTFYYHSRLAARLEDGTGRPYTGVVTETDKALMPRNCLPRQPWFKVPCCPPNIAMAIATIGQYVYAASADAVYVNQYLENTATVPVGSARVQLTQQTRYPWDERVVLTIKPQPTPWHGEICLRIPDWSRGLESTGGLYRPRHAPQIETWTVRLNGRAVTSSAFRQGYLVLRREWVQGDEIELILPMPVLRITSHPQVTANRGRVALQRGPIVYCVEAVDHSGRTRDVFLPRVAALQAEHRPDLLAGVTVVKAEARRQRRAGTEENIPLLAIPYAVWANREVGEMDVWLREEPSPSWSSPRGR
jgi:uncharacterized protein